MPNEVSWMNKILKQVKYECDKVRSIQHILSRKNHASSCNYAIPAKDTARVAGSFGSVFTDHMLKMEFDESRGGWQLPEITEFQSLTLHPAAKVLHYATSLFEGMKAYRGVDNKIRLFRPMLNLQRLNQSAERACLPKVDTHLLLKYIEKLIAIDQEFVPYTTNSSLYIRPALIGTDPEIIVGENKTALLYVILSPCGSYFKNGSEPLRLYADPAYARAWPGGCGEYKMASNYAPTIYVQKKGREFGCQQVLWLYGPDEQLTEAGTMTLFMLYLNDERQLELVTPPLEDGLILPGITRLSILELAREWNELTVSERPVTMSEVLNLNKENRLLELFGAGTACVVAPIGEVYYKGEVISIPTSKQISPVYARLYKSLNDIQYGKVLHPWAVEIDQTDSQKEAIRSRLWA